MRMPAARVTQAALRSNDRQREAYLH
jgi:hypothetical protein